MKRDVSNMLKEIVEKGNKCIVLNIFESGSQHVDSIQTQNVYTTKQKAVPKVRDTIIEEQFNDDTPLSALFRKSHHEELKKRVDSWRQYLIDDDPNIDTVSINNFQFDMTAIRPVSIYMDLAYLVNHDALRPPMSVLARYMYQHSNLSRSKNALYVQLKRYRKMCK